MALMRIQKEYNAVLDNPVPDVSCNLKDDDMFNWNVTMKGPEESPYDGGTFNMTVHFPGDYPFKPPRLQFNTKIYHPNINVNGGVCLDILKDRWSPVLTIGHVLAAIRNLLIEANTDDPLEPEIAQQYNQHRKVFNRMAADWTRRFATA